MIHFRPRSRTQQTLRKKPKLSLISPKNSTQKPKNMCSLQKLRPIDHNNINNNQKNILAIGDPQGLFKICQQDHIKANNQKRKRFMRVYSSQSESSFNNRKQGPEVEQGSNVDLVGILRKYLQKTVVTNESSVGAFDTPINKLSIFEQLKIQDGLPQSMTTRPPLTQKKRGPIFFGSPSEKTGHNFLQQTERILANTNRAGKMHVFSKQKLKNGSFEHYTNKLQQRHANQ